MVIVFFLGVFVVSLEIVLVISISVFFVNININFNEDLILLFNDWYMFWFIKYWIL